MKLLYAVIDKDRLIVKLSGPVLRLLTAAVEVDDSYGFESPHPDNQWIFDNCGIQVFRKCIYFAYGYCVAVFEAIGSKTLNTDYIWTEQIPSDPYGASSALLLAKNSYNSKTAPWMDYQGITQYLSWAAQELAVRGTTIADAIVQIKNAYMSSVFRIPTDMGAVYLKITSSVYVNNAAMEQKLTAKFGDMPVYLAVSPDGYASLTQEMSGFNCQSGNHTQYKAWLRNWSAQQVRNAGQNIYGLVDCSPQKLLSTITDFDQHLQHLSDILSTPLSQTDQEKLRKKLSDISTSLVALSKSPLPSSICHADIRPGNIQILKTSDILYDWGMAFYGHPFYDAIHFLHVVRRQLTDTQKEEIIDAYLSNWGHYGNTQMLYDTYRKAEECKAYFMLAADYRWVFDILKLWGGIPPMGTIDSWLFEKRLYYFARGLHRFIGD